MHALKTIGAAACFFVATCSMTACGDVKKTVPAKACTKEYEQCTLASGVLGVCNAVDCAEGQPAPCLVCRSQH
jgi:hypothetical protein